jgi:hypothetical protein
VASCSLLGTQGAPVLGTLDGALARMSARPVTRKTGVGAYGPAQHVSAAKSGGCCLVLWPISNASEPAVRQTRAKRLDF